MRENIVNILSASLFGGNVHMLCSCLIMTSFMIEPKTALYEEDYQDIEEMKALLESAKTKGRRYE